MINNIENETNQLTGRNDNILYFHVWNQNCIYNHQRILLYVSLYCLKTLPS